jgi:Flp pilus assembly protein TadD
MITSETQVRDFEKAQPLPSFRLRAPNTNPFVPSFPASVTGTGPSVQFNWSSTGPIPVVIDDSGRMLNVVQSLRRDAGRFPKSAVVRINLAIALSNQGNLDEAEQELRGALALEPSNYLTRINLAHLLTRRGSFEDATKLYNELLIDRPNDNTVLVSLAVMALRSNDLRGAEDLLRRAIENKGGEATIHFLLGMVQLGMKNTRAAVAELRTASRLDVRNPTIHQALGVIFAVRSEFDRAEQEFRAALMLVPNDRSSIRSLYQVLLNQKKTTEAVDLLKDLVERNPGDMSAREALAMGLLDQKKFSSARFHLSNLLAKAEMDAKEQTARIQANIGLSWLLEGNAASAKAALNKAIAIDAGVSPIAYENLARLFLSQDDLEDARDVLLECQKIFPDSTSTAILLSHVYSLLGDTATAIKALDAFKRGHENNPIEVFVYLSFYYTLTLDLEASMKISEEGLKGFPHNAMLMNNLAYVYAMTGRLEEARTTLRRIPKDISNPFPVELTATRGLVRLREGDEKQGVELYETAERLAREVGNKELVRRVRQKKYLEVARHLIDKKAFEQAAIEIRKGLEIHPKYFSYTAELAKLSNELSRLGSGRAIPPST